MPSAPIILILGADQGIGVAVARKFASGGYSIALGASGTAPGKTSEGYVVLKFDHTDPSSVPEIFKVVKSELGSPPSVVVYDASTTTISHESPLSRRMSLEDVNGNTVSAYVAAHEAAKGFDELARETRKAFIYLGDMNTKALPVLTFLTLGPGNSSYVHWIEAADAAHRSKGYRFFHVEQRNPDRSPVREMDPVAHSEFFWELVSEGRNLPWHATFVRQGG